MRASRRKMRGLRHRIGRIVRWTVLLLVALVAVAVYAALFTTSGARWLARRAMAFVPALGLEIEDGRLWDGLDVRAIRWHKAGLAVEVDAVQGRWNLKALHRRHAELVLLRVDGVRVEIEPDQERPPREAPREPGRRLRLPITGVFNRVQVNEVSVRVGEQEVSWATLAVAGRFEEQAVRFDGVTLEGLVVRRDEKETAQQAPPVPLVERLDPARRQAIELPGIHLPLDLYLADLRIAGIRVESGDRVEEVETVTLAADLVGQKLTVHQAGVEHARLTGSLEGHVTLAGEYPLDVRLNAEVRELAGEEPLRVEAQVSDRATDLRVALSVRGLVDVDAVGRISPLAPSVPVDLRVTWEELGWPLQGPARVQARNGSVQVDGSLEAYRVEAGFELDGAQIPEGRWEMVIRGDWRRATLETVNGHILGGTVALSGEAGWAEGPEWDLAIAVEGLQPDLLFPSAPTGVDLRAGSAGRIGAEGLEMELELAAMEARWNGIPMQASGRVTLRPESGWRLDAGRVAWEGGEVEIDATWHEAMDVRGRVEVADLSVLHPGAGGRLSGRLHAHGAPDSPHVRVELEGDELAWQDLVRLDTLSLEGEVAALGSAESAVRLEGAGIRMPRRDLVVGDLRLDLAGTRAAHALTMGMDGGAVALALRLGGGMDEALHWTGTIEEASVTALEFQWALEDGPVALAWDPERGQASVDAHAWRLGEARLRFPDPLHLGAEGAAALRLEDFELEDLARWLPPDLHLTGFLDIDAHAAWGGGRRPAAEVHLAVREGTVGLADPDALEDEVLRMPFETLVLAAGLEQDRGWLNAELAAEQLGRAVVETTLDIGPDGTPGALAGSLVLEGLKIGVARPFLPLLRTLDGEIHADVRVTGDFRAPRFEGELVLSDAAVEVAGLPVDLSGIEIRLAVDGESGTLAGGFRSGEGEATLAGEADWSGETWEATARLQGSALELVYGEIATLTASPDLALSLGPGAVRVSGRVTVPEAQISIRQLPETAVRSSGDVVFLQETAEETEEALEDGPTAWGVAMDLAIDLGDRVAISGYGLDARLAGGLEIRQVLGGVPQLVGEIRLVDGRYRAYGQRLTVRQGRFLFAGPADQVDIYVEAVRPVPAHNVVAGLRLEGRPEDPRMTLFSEPALPEEEVLSFLILGRPIAGSGDEGVSVLARAAVSLGVAGGSRFVGVAEEFGVEDVQVDTAGTGEETQVVVSGRIGPRLQLSYGMGVFTPISRVMMRYQLTGRLFLEAVSSAENSLDLFYTFSF